MFLLKKRTLPRIQENNSTVHIQKVDPMLDRNIPIGGPPVVGRTLNRHDRDVDLTRTTP